MTLDEAIKHAEDVAEREYKNAKNYPRPDRGVKGSGKKYNTYLKSAEEHRQLAEWLKELKQLREQVSRPEKPNKYKEDTKQAILGFAEFFKGITGNQDLKIPDDIAKKYEIESNRWIPVSERLPEGSGVYIVTREFTDGFECADLSDACYFDGTGTWHDDNRINHGRAYVDKKIKAWMPLPEPYKASPAGAESEE